MLFCITDERSFSVPFCITDASALCVQKKDAHIKTIPAFKPIPAENATPDSTPEKEAVGPPKLDKEKKVNRMCFFVSCSSKQFVLGCDFYSAYVFAVCSHMFTCV